MAVPGPDRRHPVAGYLCVLTQAGWHSGDPTGAHTRLHHAYQQATTMTFLDVILGQIGTASLSAPGGRRCARSGCSATATCCGRSRASRDRPRVRVRPTVSSAARHRRPTRAGHAAADPVPIHRLGRRRAPQVGDPDPVLAARGGRHTSTRRLRFGSTSNEHGRGKQRRTPWPVPDGRLQQWLACCGVRGNQRLVGRRC